MPSFNYYLDVPYKRFLDKVQQWEIESKIKDYKKKNAKIPVSLLNERETTIYLIITINRRSQIKIKTDFKIYPKYWDFKKRLPNGNGVGNFELEEELYELKVNVMKKFREVSTAMEELSLDVIKKAVTPIIKNTEALINNNDFFEVYDKFVKRSTKYSTLTIKKYKTIVNTLKQFEKMTNYKITFESIDSNFDNKLRNFLIAKKKYVNNTIDKYYTNLKTFLKWANNEGYTKNLYFKKFSYYNDPSEIKTLDLNHFLKIVELEPTEERLQKVKDVFLFQCLVGQRYSDIAALKHEDIKNGVWYLYQHKGKKTIATEIPLHEYSIKILDKYKACKKPIPVISNQKYNDYLKELGKAAGIDEPVKTVAYSGNNKIESTVPLYELISSHIARKSAINILASLGVQIEVVQAITGHKDIGVILKHYRKVSVEEKKNAIDRIKI